MPEQKLEKIVKNSMLGIMGALLTANVYMANYWYSDYLKDFKNPIIINLFSSALCSFFPYFIFHEDPAYKKRKK